MLVARRRLVVPEVVQTSAMDCGPAALKALAGGFGIPVSYGRLREACQTDVDGTSIDTLEEVARQLGLDAEQVMVPAEHLFLPGARLLPAIVVVRRPDGVPHFTVVWRRFGSWLQVMDPASGRRVVRVAGFLSQVHRHGFRMPASDWHALGRSPIFQRGLAARMRRLGVGRGDARTMIATASAAGEWRPLAALDAATRMTDALVRAGGVALGRDARALLIATFRQETTGGGSIVPATYWGALPDRAEGARDSVLALGAVVVRVRGRLDATRAAAPGDGRAPASPELSAALGERRPRPLRALLGLVRADGFWILGLLLPGLLIGALLPMAEALAFRAFLVVGGDLSGIGRLAFATSVLVLLAGGLALEWAVVTGLLRAGRHLEGRLRVAFQSKIARLAERYFGSRTVADMAERVHACQAVRGLPPMAGVLARACMQLLLTAAGIAWLDPAALPVVVLAAGVALIVPLALLGALSERELRARSHRGALGRFFLDALVGLVPLRVHGAEPAVRREHEALLAEWFRAGVDLRRGQLGVEGVAVTAGFGAAAFVVCDHLLRHGVGGATLLLVYWALRLPELGTQIAQILFHYPAQRNATLRVLEALNAPEEPAAAAPADAALAPVAVPRRRSGLRAAGPAVVATRLGSAATPVDSAPGARAAADEPLGCAIEFRDVCVRAGGHTILAGVDAVIEPGEHVAVVGPSGAGKSTLVGLLLGEHRASDGRMTVDGKPLDAAGLPRLRRETVWIDPSVRLWNRSLLHNVTYGAGPAAPPVTDVLAAADLSDLLPSLPQGLQERLGEAGVRLSGGEGQRVRVARGLYRSAGRLVVLDEAFRGLARAQREHLTGVIRDRFPRATVLAVTHDLATAARFDRVMVLERGRLVEHGRPDELKARGGRFAALCAAEADALNRVFGAAWRRFDLRAGRLVERRGDTS